MKKNAMSLTVIAIISALTVTILCFTAITKANSDYNIESSTPQDFDFSKGKQAHKFEQQLDKIILNTINILMSQLILKQLKITL